MTITNEQAGQYVDVLATLNETGKLGYAIAKNLRKISDEAKEYLELRAKLMQEHGKVIGNQMTINKSLDPVGYKAYMDAMGDIPQIKIDVDIFQVDEDVFVSGTMTSSQMTALLWMVKED